MPNLPHLIALGSGQVAAAGVGNKAALLDRALRSGLAVPPGFVLLAESEGRLRGSAHFRLKIAVRSAFSAEDHPWESLAGFFLSKLWVDPRNRAELASALEEVWLSAERRPGEFRRDILLIEMVQALWSGVAFTERDFEDDLVRWTRGTGERLVAGQERGDTLELPKLLAREVSRLPHTVPGFAPRLQHLLHEVRRVFGPHDWDIEWADDGRVCWLLQIRPIARPLRRNEAFTFANHKEILPDLPSRFMTSVIASAAKDVFAYFRSFDRGLPYERPFIEVFEGRPLVNLTLLCDLMRFLGLPTNLATNSMGVVVDRAHGWNPRRILRKWPTLLGMVFDQIACVRSTRRVGRALLRRTEIAPEHFRGTIDDFRWVYIRMVKCMLLLASALSGPLWLLRRLGVLAAWTARQRTSVSEIFRGLVELKRAHSGLAGAEFEEDFSRFLDRHGRRGIYESDIARPRYHEQPEALRAALAAAPDRVPELPALPGRFWIAAPAWWQASRCLKAREGLRQEAMEAFDRLRRALLALASRDGVDPDVLWMLSLEEVARLDDGWRPSSTLLQERRRELLRLSRCRLPGLVHRFDDFSAFYSEPDMPAPPERLRGLGLTPGEVTGRAWVLDEPATSLPEGWSRETTIAVARSVDAGWVPTLMQVAGAVVETGGDLTDGSIILREIGLPAVTNVALATRAFRTGDPLRLHAAQGWVERIV